MSIPVADSTGSEWMRAADGDVRLLHKLSIAAGDTGLGNPRASGVGVVVDVETTGLSADDVVVELALRRFRYDDAGRITTVGQRWSWLEDPFRPLSDEVAKLTGLDDGMLAGQEIDTDAATLIINSATLVIAHNAKFDRPRVEARLPATAGQGWACSCAEIDWRGHGFEGRSLSHLLSQIGFHNAAHRASDDVDSTIALLAQELQPGRTALAELVERSFRDSWIVRANGAAFEMKDALKARGYRWDGDRRVWWAEVAEREPEEWWLAANVYSVSSNPKALGPEWSVISNRERWS